jgi:SulP family sulfate permease
VKAPAIPPLAGALTPARPRLGAEVVAGVVLAALCLPLNLGYAEAAGLPAEVGIYATLLPLVVYAVLAGSRHLVVGPDATIAAFMAAAFGPIIASSGVAPTELAIGLSMLVGLVLLLAWLFQAGSIVRFLSKAVLVGFIAGLAIEVLTSQVRKIMNVRVEADSWPAEVWQLVKAVPDASAASVAVGLGTIALLRIVKRISPRLPAALIALVLVAVIVAALEPAGVALLGEVPSGLPSPTLPTFGLSVWLDLLPIAVAIAALTIAEGVLLAKSAARADHETFVPNPELFSLGASNVAASLTGAMPIGASASRTAAMQGVGTVSQVPALVAAVVVVVVVLFFTDAVAQLPSAALAGLVANAVLSTIEVDALREFARVRRSELAIALGCAAGVLLLGPLGGIVIAVLASAVDVVRRAADAPWAHVELAGDDATTARYAAASAGAPGQAAGDGEPGGPEASDGPDTIETAVGIRVVRPGTSLFFANAEELAHVLASGAADPSVEWVVLDLERVADIDPTAAEALREGAAEVRDAGKVLALTRMGRHVGDLLERYEMYAVVDPAHVFASNRAAARAFAARPGA